MQLSLQAKYRQKLKKSNKDSHSMDVNGVCRVFLFLLFVYLGKFPFGQFPENTTDSTYHDNVRTS